MLLRIGANFLLFFSILFLPWWVTAIFALVGIFFFTRFYEAVAWMLAADLLYGTQVAAWFDMNVLLSASALLAFIGIEFFKKRLRLYQV